MTSLRSFLFSLPMPVLPAWGQVDALPSPINIAEHLCAVFLLAD